MNFSFISEHSLEYIVIPRLSEMLREYYRRIVPIYYRATREGNMFSEKLHSNLQLRIFAAFPRRPKFENIASTVVCGKINESIMQFADAARSYGIPTIFCLPIVRSLRDITSDCRCVFLNVSQYVSGDIYFRVRDKGELVDVECEQNACVTPIDSAAVVAIAQKGQVLSWHDAILNLNALRNSNTRHHSSFWMSQYKPVYLLLLQ